MKSRVSALLLLYLAGSVAATQPVTSDERGDPVDHKEVAVPPPAAPVTRQSQPRSPRAVIQRDNFQSVQVNVDLGQMNIVGDAANEPSIAVDPTNPDNIVIGWRQFGSITSDFRQAGMAYSHDGGATWTFPGPLQPAQFRSDPVLAADSEGNFYYYSLSSVTTTEYFVSLDKGVNWIGPTFSPGGDKNWQTIDLSGGFGDGHVYPIWNSQFTCCAAGTDFSRSTNAAMTFEGPYSLPIKPKWGTNDVGPDGELYIVGATLDAADGHVILRSDDADDPLATPTFPLASNIDLGGTTAVGDAPNPAGLLGQVWVAVDRSAGATRGNVYVLGSVEPTGADPLDVHFIRSVDGGQTWSTPQRVNDDPRDNGAFQWFGTMSVAPDGRIDVVWLDTRAGTATMSELYYAYSIDAGITFSSGIPVSPAFDSTVGWPVQQKMGDYYHMVSDSTGAGLAYSATFNGEQDVYYLRVGDCNDNGQHDSADLAAMSSADTNTNGVPDECEPDCNGNGVPDVSDIAGGASDDCNNNGNPDECDVADTPADDCDGNLMLDACEATFDGEAGQGFAVGAPDDTATAGHWEQGDPIGTDAQPDSDHTPDPGKGCYFTGQGTPGGANAEADVDSGKTTLFSPTLDLSAMSEPWVGYWRWYSNNAGPAAGSDTFVVDVSSNGGTNWQNVEVVGPTGAEAGGGWFFHSFRVADRVTPTANVMLRFVASDLGSGSIVEAAIDDLVVVDCIACAVAPPGEVANLTLSLSGMVATLNWDAELLAETYDIYRGSAQDATDLACAIQGVVGTSTVDDGLVPAPGGVLYYVATAANCGGESILGSGRVADVSCP